MIFPLLTTNNVITLPETADLTSTFLMWVLSALYAFMSMDGRPCSCYGARSQEGGVMQYAGRLLLPFSMQHKQTRDVEVGVKAEIQTGLTANEKNSYQRSPERRSSSGHGRWSATLRSGRGSPVSGTEKIQRIQR